MRESLIASAVLHVGLIALVLLGLPVSDRKLDIPPSIPVELVDIGDVAEAARVEKGDDKTETQRPPIPEAKPTPPAPPPPEPAAPPPPLPPPPAPKAPEPPPLAQIPPPPREPEPPRREPPKPVPPPPPPPPEPAPAPVRKPPPEPPKPEPPKPEPPKPPPPKAEPPKAQPAKPEPAKPEPAKPQPPKEQPRKPPEKVDPLAALLSEASKMKPTDRPSKPSASSAQARSPSSASGPKSVAGPDRAFKPSGKAIDAIRGQVGRNWNFDPGRREAGSMAVEIRIEVAPDGTVLRADMGDQTRARASSDREYRAAAEAALRAVLKTQKLDLATGEFTPETYEKWRVIVFNFDPRDMF